MARLSWPPCPFLLLGVPLMRPFLVKPTRSRQPAVELFASELGVGPDDAGPLHRRLAEDHVGPTVGSAVNETTDGALAAPLAGIVDAPTY